MSYIGNQPPDIGAYDVESFDGGGTSFTLKRAATVSSVLLFIDGVRQTPTDAYTVSGVTLTTTATTPSGTDNVTVMFMGDVVDIGAPSADTVSTAKIQDDAVTAAKLANSINTEIAANTAKVTNATHTGDVTGATALTIAVDAVDIAMLSATGTASASTFLRGDNAWAAAGGTNTPAFLAKFASSGSQTVTDGSTVKVEMTQEIYDSDSAYDPTTNYRWTPGVVGKYVIGFSVYTEDNEIIRATGHLYMNGSAIFNNHQKVQLQDQTAVCSPRHTYNGQSIVDVTDVADYFEVYCYIDTYDGGTAAIQEQEKTYFWGYRLLT